MKSTFLVRYKATGEQEWTYGQISYHAGNVLGKVQELSEPGVSIQVIDVENCPVVVDRKAVGSQRNEQERRQTAGRDFQ